MATILMLEDNVQLVKLYAMGLMVAGHLVVHKTTLADGYAWLDEYTPEMLLLDMQLPDGSGMEMVYHMRRTPRLRHTTVFILSATDQYIRQCQALGVEYYLVKPVTANTLWDVIADWAQQRTTAGAGRR